jgi:polar amino acid transport system substrate-binding protein
MLLLFLALMMLAAIVGIIALLGSIFSDDSFKVGLCESARPLAYLDEKKAAAGFEAEFAALLAQRLGRELKIKLLDREEMAEAMRDGSVDCVISARESIQNAVREFPATEPFIAYGTVIVSSPDDNSIGDAASLRGKKVGVMANTDAEYVCEKFLESTAFNVRKYDIEIQPFQDLMLKKNDAVIADELYAAYMQKTDPDSFKAVGSVYLEKQFGLRLSTKISGDYSTQIAGALRELKAGIELKNLYLQWFGEDLSARGTA